VDGRLRRKVGEAWLRLTLDGNVRDKWLAVLAVVLFVLMLI
jgi:hypothetical protein